MTARDATTSDASTTSAPPDLRPASARLARLVAGVTDEQLAAPTPCERYRLGDIVEHVGGLSMAFQWAARKAWPDAAGSRPPSGDAARLPADWRTRIPEQLAALGEARQDPQAWQGMTEAGGVALPGEVAGVVALDEVVVHGWDVARASGQPYDVDDATLGVVLGFVSAAQEQAGGRGSDELFQPPVPVPDDAPLLDKVIGLTGRDPAWTPPAG
jgi:uncharacterized protein (TIGR03086 family)